MSHVEQSRADRLRHSSARGRKARRVQALTTQARAVVRPNQWDSRERRLQDDLARLVAAVKRQHPEDFTGPDRLAVLDLRVVVLRSEQELAKPMGADLDGEVPGLLVRWWRDRRPR